MRAYFLPVLYDFFYYPLSLFLILHILWITKNALQQQQQRKNANFISKLASRSVNLLASLSEAHDEAQRTNCQTIACSSVRSFLQESTSSSIAGRVTVIIALAKSLMKHSNFKEADLWLSEALTLLQVLLFPERSKEGRNIEKR